MNRVIEAMNSGARGFLLKPFGIEEFHEAIQAALAQRAKEEEWQRLRAQLPILVISQTLLTEGDVGELSRRLLEVVARQMGSERAALMLLDEARNELEVVAVMGMPEDALTGMRLPAGEERVEAALRRREVQLWEAEPRTEPRASPLAAVSGSGQAALALIPLRTGKKDVGILALGHPASSDRAAALTPSDLSLLSIMGRQMAIAIENARMYALEQKRTAELARALEQQRELDRLKNQFIQNVSHELRTPLAMILGYAELLSSGDLGQVRDEQEGPLEIIVQRSYVLRDLIENITAILENEIREPLREPVALNELVSAAITDFQVLAGQAGLTLHGDLSEEVQVVLGDAEHLRRVVDNLIGNALKFTPAGGTVAVSLGGTNGDVMIEVTDTGIGIDAEHLGRVFDRFYQVDGTTRRTHGGCGLGLALVKEIVERHGGRVRVESQPGHGSKFTVLLPACLAAEQP
jgi:signal transduction histidine kinase